MKGIGIDFGTSNSAAAVFDGDQIRLIKIEPNAQTVPTAIHIDRDFQPLTGSTAIQTYVAENSDRRVEITAKAIGEIEVDPTNLFGEGSGESGGTKQTIYGAEEDYGLPGRLFLGIKRLLGKEQIRRLMVFERPFRLVALITPILLSIRKAIEENLNQSNSHLSITDLATTDPAKTNSANTNPMNSNPATKGIYLGRPVEFEGKGSGKNALATDRIREACTYAGLGEVTFYPEPVAACLSFVHKQNIQNDSTVLTVDFGGGTLDLCLVRYHAQQFEVLGTEGVAIGGDYIDQLIFQQLLFPALGQGIQWSRRVDGLLVETPFPFDQYEQALLNWTITHTLNQNQYTGRIAEYIAQDGPEKEKLERLRDVILHNYSYNIFQSIKMAKAELSDTGETILDVPELNLSIPFDRAQLNSIIAEVLNALRQCISSLLDKTDINPSTIDFVVRTGGSSKIAAVVELLDELFPRKVVQHDTFTSVASGLAIASYYSYACRV